MKFEKLKPGMVVYDVHKTKIGNTTRSTLGTWTVRIISVDPEKRSCMASWNSNPPQRFYEHSINKWKAERPCLVRTPSGGMRRPTREELAAHKARLKAEKESA